MQSNRIKYIGKNNRIKHIGKSNRIKSTLGRATEQGRAIESSMLGGAKGCRTMGHIN